MTELKCPVCKTGNIREYADGLHYACDNEDCPSYDETDEKTFDVLIDTKKKLDIAVEALKKYTDASGNWWYGYEFQGHYEDCAGEYADKALEQITALEQKDK